MLVNDNRCMELRVVVCLKVASLVVKELMKSTFNFVLKHNNTANFAVNNLLFERGFACGLRICMMLGRCAFFLVLGS